MLKYDSDNKIDPSKLNQEELENTILNLSDAIISLYKEQQLCLEELKRRKYRK